MLHLEENIKDGSFTISMKSSGIIVGKFEMVDDNKRRVRRVALEPSLKVDKGCISFCSTGFPLARTSWVQFSATVYFPLASVVD